MNRRRERIVIDRFDNKPLARSELITLWCSGGIMVLIGLLGWFTA